MVLNRVEDILIVLLCALSCVQGRAQSNMAYDRNSLIMMLVYHPEDELGKDICAAFESLPASDTYDDPKLSQVRVIDNSSIKNCRNNKDGYYKAVCGHQLAANEVRANAMYTQQMLNEKEVGKELENNTFVLVNDITYVTSEQEAEAAKKAVGSLGGLFGAMSGGQAGSQKADSEGDTADKFAGFRVMTHSYLYQLEWNDSIEGFQFKYVAHEYDFDKKAVLKGKYSSAELVRTICARSIDRNIVELGKQYEDFKLKTPVYEVLKSASGKIEGYAAKIGMKEGITELSKFQVVQRVINSEKGETTYKYVATVKPKEGLIWDNRYNAVLEEADGATLPYTTFVKTAGGEILPGMLLIEGKYRKVVE